MHAVCWRGVKKFRLHRGIFFTLHSSLLTEKNAKNDKRNLFHKMLDGFEKKNSFKTKRCPPKGGTESHFRDSRQLYPSCWLAPDLTGAAGRWVPGDGGHGEGRGGRGLPPYKSAAGARVCIGGPEGRAPALGRHLRTRLINPKAAPKLTQSAKSG